MRVYHGSYVAVTNPDLMHSRENVDFGKGFYTTPIYEQAEQWAGRFRKQNKKGIVSAYYFDGLIDKTEAIKRLMYEETNLQITFRTEKALSKLVFERSVEV